MDFQYWIDLVFSWVGQHPVFGSLIGFAMAGAEAFIPPVPLVAIVTANVYVFGYLFGFLFSWLGTTTGTYLVFLVIQKFFVHRFEHFRTKHPKIDHSFSWIKEKGFVPMVLMYIFPFTPSIMVSGLAALAEVKHKDFLLSVIIGKFFMVLSLSAIGLSLTELFTKPWLSVGVILVIVAVTALAKGYLTSFQRARYLKNRLKDKVHHHKQGEDR